MSNKSDNIDIPQPNVEEAKYKTQEKAHSGLWYTLNPWAKKEQTNLVPTPLKEEEIFSMDDSEECESDGSEDSIGVVPDDWEEVARKKQSCCYILTTRLSKFTNKDYTPLVTQYEVEIDKQWKMAEKFYNDKCTAENFNQTVDYYLKQAFQNIGWICFGLALGTTQKKVQPVYMLNCDEL